MEDCQLLGRFHQFQFPQLTEWSHLPIMSIRTGKFIQRPPHFHSFSTVTHLAGSQRLHKTALWISEALHPFPSMTFAPETLVESLLVESGGHFREVIFVARRDDHNPPQSTTISGTPSVPHLCGLCASRAFLAFGDSKLLLGN